MRWVGITVLVAACWTKSPVTDQTKPPTDRSAVDENVELIGTLRIDPAPGPRGFQGVFLEVPGRGTLLVDYRPRGLWRPFDGAEVVVTGGCYEPSGEAIDRTHFRVDSLRASSAPHGERPYLSIGREQVISGGLRKQAAAPGSKMAGSTWPVFVAESGEVYIAVGDDLPPLDRALKVRARVLEPDMSYTARMGGPDLWILSVVDDEEPEPRPIRCP